mmetsp:Transcript_2309/g.4981  ORF Transcript_2309/g.4981 Transcript_2309/m.4981 type:complete len:758 (-) Transcript_2309:125-2398(-)
MATTFLNSSSQHLMQPPSKKLKGGGASWKVFQTENHGREGKIFGLQDLFAHDFDSKPTTSRSMRSNAIGSTNGANASNASSNQFYTLRLEHRIGGPTASHRNEERILLFRSDKPGAIAKIIYSSSLPDGAETELNVARPRSMSKSGECEARSSATASAAQAKIHVLDVKAPYRGKHLGGLLFSEAITSLKSKYCNPLDEVDDGNGAANISESSGTESDGASSMEMSGMKRRRAYDVECVLDAEEDTSRHGKLVQFYEDLGCKVKSSNRIQYVNNNDTETYRKVPMRIDLHAYTNECPAKKERARMRRKKFTHLVSSSKGSFLPIKLVGPLGKLLVRCFATGQELKLDWLATESSEGIQFCTTHGHLLLASPTGAVYVLSTDDQDLESSDLDIDAEELNKWTHFVPCHISDEENEAEDNSTSSQVSSGNNDLWVMRTCHGTFLTADSLKHTLSCTRLPSFWQASGANLSLVCTSDTPPRRHHYRKCWKFQTYDYVLSMRSRFLNFSLGKATLIEALGWIDSFPAHPFHSWSSDEGKTAADDTVMKSSTPSLRTLSFIMAETAREEGLPDWVQLVALLHELGEAVKVLDPTHTGDMADSIYDWTISSRSRVVGCKPPHRATFSEYRHLNMDLEDSKYNTNLGVYKPQCGLQNVLLMWTGCEYMYYLLKHNHATLPEEGFAMIRYFLLGDWHEHHEYSAITNADDADVMPFVAEFDALRRRVRLKSVDCNDLSDDQCSELWESHYVHIASKYNCEHVFSW